MRNIIDYMRLKIVLWIESNRNISLKYDKRHSEYLPASSIEPIISSYIERKNKVKSEIICNINGIIFTRLEAITIHSITAEGSSYINQSLASPRKKISRHQKIIINVFDRVLRKTQRTENKYVYRMDVQASDDEEKALTFFNDNLGTVINIPWFLSTTELSEPWGTIVWKIRIGNNKKTKARHFYPLINNHGNEYEIRFERDLKLKILSIEEALDESDEKYFIINMEECDTTKFDTNLNYSKY